MGTVGGNLCLDTRCIFYNQSEWWRDANHHCLKTTGDDLPRRAEKPRRVLRHLQRRSGAGVADPRRRDRHRRRRRPPHAAARRSLYRLCAPGRAGDGDARRRQIFSGAARRANSSPRCARKNTPGLRSAYDKIRIRRSIEYPVAGVAVALRREGDKLADLRVAFTGTNPRPVRLAGTAALVRRRARRSGLDGPRRAGARPDHGDEDHVYARPLPPPRRRRAGAPAGAAVVRGLKIGEDENLFADQVLAISFLGGPMAMVYCAVEEFPRSGRPVRHAAGPVLGRALHRRAAGCSRR